MAIDKQVADFLSGYSESVTERALALRALLFANLPGVTEQIDIPARMIAYCYGQKYAELICTIIPSKKGVKLGFNRGTLLPDPTGLLEGTGKISRYVVIKSADDIKSPALTDLVVGALAAYKECTAAT